MKKFLFLLFIFAQTYAATSRFIVQLNDDPFLYPFPLPTHTYHAYCKNVYSQNGEDGILEQLIKELGISAGTFCEFGAADGIRTSNTFNLMQKYHFSGVAIEADYSEYEICTKHYAQFPQVKVYHGSVFYDDPEYDLHAWLTKAGLPYDFDILSIDIDGDDYYVWEGLTDFMPKIVLLEANSYRDPVCDELPGHPSKVTPDILKRWNPVRVGVGCSFLAGVKLGLKKGYIPVAYTGNIVFVRKDLIHKLTEFPYVVSNDPYDYLTLYTHLVLWKNSWMTNTGLIVNVALRDYYLKYRRQDVDITWLNKRMDEIMHNEAIIW